MLADHPGLSVPLALGAAGAAIVWLCALVVVTRIRRPPRIRAEKASMDLPPVSPAIAGLLANDFDVPTETAPAVVLDLAARRVIDLDEVQPGRTIARLRKRHDEQLTTYEHRILEELEQKAIDGVVPTEAMTTGTEQQSASWHRDLKRQVVADAQSLGLTYNRWTRRVLSILTIGLALPGGLLYLFLQDFNDDTSGDWLGWATAATAIAIIVFGATMLGRMSRSFAQLPTAAGLVAARRVAALQRHIRDADALADLPPASVVLRNRYFAYAAAFGLAPLAVALLPMGAEDDHRAWSRVGGRWRRVRVRYPRAWPPGWGKHPGFATLLAVVWAAVAIFLLWQLARLADSSPPASVSGADWRWVERGSLVVMAPFVLVTLWAVFVLVRAVPDLWSTRQITGEIVRDRRFRQWFTSGDNPRYWNYLAIDDGTSDRIVALRLRESVWSQQNQGDEVTAEITTGLGYVRTMTKESP